MSGDAMATIGRDTHGCVVTAYVHTPGDAMEAREIRRWIKDGLAIETTTVEAVRAMSFGCAERKKARRP